MGIPCGLLANDFMNSLKLSTTLGALGQVSQVGIRLALGADKAGEGVGGELLGVDAILVQLANVDLDRGVVLGSDDAVGGGAVTSMMKNSNDNPIDPEEVKNG
jgi:hypothetical protein